MSATAVIVDDEPLALSHLRRKLQILWPDLQVIGEANSGTDAIAIVHATQPDIVFLDIQMPGLSGLDVATALPRTCQIVFVTAYDQYAINAFEHSAVDYLLKPVSDKRLVQCIERLRQRETPDLVSVQDLLKQFGEAELAMTLLLTPERKLARVEAPKVLESIAEQGFFLQMPPSTFEAKS